MRRAAVLVTVAVLVTAAGAAPAPARAPAQRITFGNTTCAPGWQAPNPGLDRFAVVNQSTRTATVYLFRADSGDIVATIASSRPGSVRAIAVRLTPGPYAWGCDLTGYPRHISDAVAVPPHPQAGGNGPAVVPVQVNQLAGPLLAYRGYVDRRLAALGPQLGALVAQIGARNLAGAQSAWLTAHLTWLDIGQDDGAYGAFGELGRQIDGTAAGLVGGIVSPAFTGFHRVEYDLWTLHDLSAAAGDAQRLSRLAGELTPRRVARALPAGALGVTDWTLRCHEVLEDGLRDSLSADDDYGSGTDAASVTADVAATRELLGLLAPLIGPRSPYLVGVASRELTTLDGALDAARTNGRWLAVPALTLSRRERIDAAIGAALETLAPVPDLLRVGST
jgi:high-affinity iron transporter